MKKIIAAVDFSEASLNALDHAVNLAKVFGAELTLLNVVTVPMPISEVPGVIVSSQELKEIATARINKLVEDKVKKQGVNPKVDIRVGFPIEEIGAYCSSESPDLLVMGMKNMGRASELLIGSTSTSMIEKSKQSILVVPEGVAYKAYSKIVYANDFQKAVDEKQIKPLRDIASRLSSKVFVANFISDAELNSKEETEVSERLEKHLQGISHSYYFPVAKDITIGISAFVEMHGADLVVMTHHKQSFLKQLLNGSKTKHMAFICKHPVLNLSEQN